jgi:hypothetical protein
MISAEEHLAWCKARALEFVDENKLNEAWMSMTSDLGKHPDTKDHPAILLGNMLRDNGHLNTQYVMREFIEDFA